MDEKCSRFIKKMKVQYSTFFVQDYEEIYIMFQKRIDRYSVKYLTGKRIRDMEKAKECIVARTEDNKIVAACNYMISGSVAYLENIASDSAHNGTGIGSSLFCRELKEIFERGAKKAIFWIWENNIESKKMSERFAVLTGRFSQYIVFESEAV